MESARLEGASRPGTGSVGGAQRTGPPRKSSGTTPGTPSASSLPAGGTGKRASARAGLREQLARQPARATGNSALELPPAFEAAVARQVAVRLKRESKSASLTQPSPQFFKRAFSPVRARQAAKQSLVAYPLLSCRRSSSSPCRQRCASHCPATSPLCALCVAFFPQRLTRNQFTRIFTQFFDPHQAKEVRQAIPGLARK